MFYQNEKIPRQVTRDLMKDQSDDGPKVSLLAD